MDEVNNAHDKRLGGWLSNEDDIQAYSAKHGQEWMAKLVLGPPRATQKMSVADLTTKGFKGVYFDNDAQKAPS